jgi:peptidoglycan hydrolase-like protein with peptidoglycan-binding domain
MREHAAEGSAPEATEEAVAVAPPAALPVTAPLTVQGLLGIQRHAGNRAAAALVARAPTATKDGTLAMGATGSAVTALQMHLNLLDEVKTELVTDGIYGPITTSAVRQFQSAHPPLKATGAADSETQAAIAEALKEDQNQEDIGRKLFNLGGRSYERGKYGHAYAFFTRAGELADRPGITFSRAQALRRLGGRREEAIALYEQYLATGHGVRDADAKAALKELKTPDKTGDDAKDTATAKSIFTHGGALYEAGDFAHAYDEFSRAGEMADRPGIIFSRAQALRRMGGRREEAIALYEQYLARGDGTRKKDAEAALQELRAPEATGDEAKDTATAKKIFNKGGALYESGDYAHAYDEFTRASELADRPGVLFSRAQALRRMGGRESEAMALYQQYIDLGEGSRLEDAKQMLALLQSHGAAP